MSERPTAELQRMSTGQWGAAITVQGQETTEGGRFVTIILDRPRAEAYGVALLSAIESARARVREITTNAINWTGSVKVAHSSFGTQDGKPFPHIYTSIEAVRLMASEIFRVCHEIRLRERKEEKIYSHDGNETKDRDTTR